MSSGLFTHEDIAHVHLDDTGNGWANLSSTAAVCCPICHGGNQHADDCYHASGSTYQTLAGNASNGVIIVTFWGECGSHWDMCVATHKGESSMFARVRKSCGG